MNTKAALAILLDSRVSVAKRQEVFSSVMGSEDPELDKPLIIASIIKSKCRGRFRNTAIVQSPLFPSPETVALLRNIVESPYPPKEFAISLVALTKIEQVDAVPLLRSSLEHSDIDVQIGALDAISYLPKDVGNSVFREAIGNPLLSNDIKMAAAFDLAKRGDNYGREVFWQFLDSDELHQSQIIVAFCGLAYLKDQDGISSLIDWLRTFLGKSGEGEVDSDKSFRFIMLKRLCGFRKEDEAKDWTAMAIEHLESLLEK